MTSSNSIMAKEIRNTRARVGLSQKLFAKELGTSRSNLQQYEEGTRIPGIEMCMRIQKRFNVPACDWFMKTHQAIIHEAEKNYFNQLPTGSTNKGSAA